MRWRDSHNKGEEWRLAFTFIPTEIDGQNVWLEWIETRGNDYSWAMGDVIYRLLEKTPENERRKKVKLYKSIIVIVIILLTISFILYQCFR